MSPFAHCLRNFLLLVLRAWILIIACFVGSSCQEGADTAAVRIKPDEIEALVIYAHNRAWDGDPKSGAELVALPHLQLSRDRTRRVFAKASRSSQSVTGLWAMEAVGTKADGTEVLLRICPGATFFTLGTGKQSVVYHFSEESSEEALLVSEAFLNRVYHPASFWRHKVLPRQANPGVHVLRAGALYGFADARNQIVIKPQFADAQPFSEQLAAVRVGDPDTGRWGYIDEAGRFVIEPQFVGASFFSEGRAAVTVSDFYLGNQGYIDRKGRFVISPQFDLAYPFVDGNALVYKEHEGWRIDVSGNTLKW
jgi:hypothetical protein